MIPLSAAPPDPATSEVWHVLFQLVVLLALALVMGTLFERFRQSAILGYLIAGMLVGPGMFDIVDADSGVPVIAELGVSLLLFAIGLEFSARSLLKLGPAAGIGGTLQITLTLGLGALAALIFGLDGKGALAVGATVALSSTACVLRLLTDRAELDSVHGRTALGILLMQDVAVVPLVLLVTMLSEGGTFSEVVVSLLKAAILIVSLVTGFLLLSKFVLPPLMRQLSLARDRELLVLLSVVLAIGSALAAHSLNLSPALGAFLAGMLLAESPFATQVRSDIGGLRIVFITLFFASVGMLGDPHWIARHAFPVLGITALLLAGKALVITGIALGFRLPPRHAVASGILLAQVGEFGIVIAGIANGSDLFPEETFRYLVSATLVSLFATPLLIRVALPIGDKIQALLPGKGSLSQIPASEKKDPSDSLVLIVGFGPSGQRVAEEVRAHEGVTPRVIEMKPNNVDLARSMGVDAVLGDATNLDFLIHEGISRACAIVITLPDHRTAIKIVESVRTLNHGIVIIVRARYHTFVDELERAGATIAVDEEYLTGTGLTQSMKDLLDGEEAVGPRRQESDERDS
ncbi:MAG: sodium:proton exchanger [Verrucomicrobiales bacterium]|nr:sodium:proton exchanger [Verrucomicrobiales bacterium]